MACLPTACHVYTLFCLVKRYHWQAPCCCPLSLLLAQLVCWCAVCVVDVPRRRVPTGPALTCLTRRRCRNVPFALKATATSGPFFCCAVVLQNEDSQPFITTHSCTTSGAQPGVVGVALVCKGGLLPFVVRCSARCLASFLSQGLVLCLWRAGEAPVLCLCGCVLCAFCFCTRLWTWWRGALP